jgi:hypothetical protein
VPIKRPWGNEADDEFHSIDPIEGGPLTKEDLLNEKVETHASLAVIAKLGAADMTDQTLYKYLHHPEYDLRSIAMDQLVKRGKVELIVPLLESDDARLRQAGLLALTGMFKGSPLALDKVTPEMNEQVVKMLNNPNESWWVVLHAIEALGRGDKSLIAPHRDRLLKLMEYKCTWIQTAAVCTLAKICTEPDHYKTVLPAIVKQAASFRVDSASSRSTKAIADSIKTANPEVKTFADGILKTTYTSMPSVLKEPNTGAVLGGGGKVVKSRIGSIVQELPGGLDFVKKIPKTTLKSYISGKDADMYIYSGTFVPNKALEGTWAWAIYPAPNNPGEIDAKINAFVAKAPAKIDKPKDVIKIADNGVVGNSGFFKGYFWSGDMLIGNEDNQALKMEVRNIGGRDFLIIERGGFNVAPTSDDVVEITKDYHCGYHVYMKQ